MTDAGMPEYMAVDWRLWAAIYAPAKTPTAVVDRLFAACNAAIRHREIEGGVWHLCHGTNAGLHAGAVNAYQTEQYGEWKALVDGLDLVKVRRHTAPPYNED